MRPGVYLQAWELGPPTAAERTAREACETAARYGCAGLLMKAFDGLHWQPAAGLADLADVSAARALADSYGLDFGIWSNPLYGDEYYLQAEAQLYAEAGLRAGMLWIDAEPYPYFWGADRQDGMALAFMETIRGLAPTLELVLQPDARPGRWQELKGWEWGQHANALAQQVYWTDFQQRPEEAVEQALQRYDGGLLQHELYAGCKLVPTLPGNASPSDLVAAVRAFRAREALETVALWRLGTAGPGQLQALVAEMAASPAPATLPPPDPCAAVAERLRLLCAQVDDELGRKRLSRRRLQSYIDAARAGL